MMNKTLAAACVLGLAVTTPAYASGDDVDCGASASSAWMSVEAVSATAREHGYEVRSVEREDGCYEVYALDRNGARVELYVNPVSGEIVHVESKS